MEDEVQPLKRGITFTFLQPQILLSRERPTLMRGSQLPCLAPQGLSCSEEVSCGRGDAGYPI